MNERPTRLTGRVFVGQQSANGQTVYRDIAAESGRPDDWRNKQAKTPIRNILTGKK